MGETIFAIALYVLSLLLFLGVLYFLIKGAVKNGIREGLEDVFRQMADNVWKDEDPGDRRRP